MALPRTCNRFNVDDELFNPVDPDDDAHADQRIEFSNRLMSLLNYRRRIWKDEHLFYYQNLPFNPDLPTLNDEYQDMTNEKKEILKDFFNTVMDDCGFIKRVDLRGGRFYAFNYGERQRRVRAIQDRDHEREQQERVIRLRWHEEPFPEGNLNQEQQNQQNLNQQNLNPEQFPEVNLNQNPEQNLNQQQLNPEQFPEVNLNQNPEQNLDQEQQNSEQFPEVNLNPEFPEQNLNPEFPEQNLNPEQRTEVILLPWHEEPVGENLNQEQPVGENLNQEQPVGENLNQEQGENRNQEQPVGENRNQLRGFLDLLGPLLRPLGPGNQNQQQNQPVENQQQNQPVENQPVENQPVLQLGWVENQNVEQTEENRLQGFLNLLGPLLTLVEGLGNQPSEEPRMFMPGGLQNRNEPARGDPYLFLALLICLIENIIQYRPSSSANKVSLEELKAKAMLTLKERHLARDLEAQASILLDAHINDFVGFISSTSVSCGLPFLRNRNGYVWFPGPGEENEEA